MEDNKILVVDDDINLLELIKIGLEDSGYDVSPASHEDVASDLADETMFSVAVIDLQLVSRDGLSLMDEIHRKQPELPVIILTAHGSIENAVEAMKRGAFTYLTKPFDARELLLQIERAREQNQLNSELHRLRQFIHNQYDFSNIIARSESMRQILEQIPKIAGTDSNVIIYGASGTGKELIAKALHLASTRKDHSFLAVNCAAIPENLLESELFGHEKGAFTGAVKKSAGLFTQANHGTLFLDEIGDMPPPASIQTLTSPAGTDNSASRQRRDHIRRCQDHCRYQQEPQRGGGGRSFPRGSLLPAPCYSHRTPAAKRQEGRHPAPCPVFYG